MGVSKETFIGPYLECGLKNDSSITKKVPIKNTCLNKECKKYGKIYNDAVYCSGCGTKMTSGNMDVVAQSIDTEQILGEICETIGDYTLYPTLSDSQYAEKNKMHIWNANIELPELYDKIRHYSYDHDIVSMPDVSGEMIENHKNIFMNEFAREIEIMKKHYGEDQVKIKWGIFNYYS